MKPSEDQGPVTPSALTEGSARGESPELAAAYANLVKAAEEYGKLAPQRPEPTEPPLIVPTLLHATPSNFHRGYNMMLDAGGYMPGKIPVMVIPARPEDLRAYACFRRAKQLRAVLGLSLPNAAVSHEPERRIKI